jgi:ribosomal protein S18 acetylase RimI-like enzyme
MSIRVRCATEADLPMLVELLRALFAIEPDFSFEPGLQRRGLAAMLADPDRRVVLVAEGDGAAVGMATGQLLVSTAEGGLACVVEDVVVAADWRHHGIGGWLLDQLARWAAERGATRLQLVADRDNASALGFYERHGWRRTRLVALHRGL